MKKKAIVCLIAIVVIVAAAIFAGCIEEEAPAEVPETTPAGETLPSRAEPKYSVGDILKAKGQGPERAYLILNYDENNDSYQTTIVQLVSDKWVYTGKPKEWNDRDYYEETLRLVKINHIDTVTLGKVPEYNSTLVRNYEIVKTEDISIKALDKPLSAYSTSEIEKLPMNMRKRYRVIVPSDISKEELKATLIQVVMDKTSENPDIDEVVVLAYDRKEDADSIYTFGRVEWCPNGDWAGVTSIIASTNDRSSYRYNFDIKDKVGSIDASDRPTEREFEIHDYYDDRLLEESKKLFEAQNAGLPYKYADQEELEEAVRTEVANKYGISEEELDKIWLKVGAYKMK